MTDPQPGDLWVGKASPTVLQILKVEGSAVTVQGSYGQVAEMDKYRLWALCRLQKRGEA
jgi:hypothetical protein